MKRPYYALYLGRKSCPLAAPLAPRRVEVAYLREALDSEFEAVIPREKQALRLTGEALYCWEGGAALLDGNAGGVESSDVWDRPLNRRRWQFGPRAEFRRFVRAEEGR